MALCGDVLIVRNTNFASCSILNVKYGGRFSGSSLKQVQHGRLRRTHYPRKHPLATHLQTTGKIHERKHFPLLYAGALV